MPELLLELGCEELPATFVEKAYSDLLALLTSALSEASLISEPNGVALGTPRRLIVSFPDVISHQPDTTKEQRGPALKSAYDAEGNPTPALLGFCRGQGVAVENLRRDDQYVWVTKQIPGRPTPELLSEILAKAIRALTFDKTMRWGATRMRFARPIRWLLAVYDGHAVPFDIEGIQSGHESRGHRFYAPQPFPAVTLKELVEGLRARKVEPDPAIRRQRILDQARAVADGVPVLPADLVDENTFLTEWPTAIQGAFRPEYEVLPDPVLVTAMAKHERMFPIRDEEGRLTNRFVFIRNSGEDDSVRSGCEWVLNARFNDAKFFHDEDAKMDMAGFLEKTSTIVFQEKLGTVRRRAERLSYLAKQIALATGADEHEANLAAQAGLYAKADLSSGLVGELTSLQGIVGGEYANREGFPEAVSWAIRTQYDPAKNSAPTDEKGRTAVRLLLADQLDKLAGYLGLGLDPSGSSDPFALRRAATILIEAAWNWPAAIPAYADLFQPALNLYREAGVILDEAAATAALYRLFGSRYAPLRPEVRYDILEAALLNPLGPETTDPQAVRFRILVLQRLAPDIAFVQTATRPTKLLIDARRKGIEYGAEDPLDRLEHAPLESADGLDLFQTLAAQSESLAEAARGQDEIAVVAALKSLAEPINRFFDKTMVMADQPEIRYARLTLLAACAAQLLTAGDFSKLVIEG